MSTCPSGHVPVWDVVCGVQQQLQDVLVVVERVHLVRDWPPLRRVDGGVLQRVPDRQVRERHDVQPVRPEPVRRELLGVLVRHRRCVRPGHHRHWSVHVRVWLLPGVVGRFVRHVRERLLPERNELRGVPGRVHELQQRCDVLGVHGPSACAARRDGVPRELRRGLLLGRDGVPDVRLDVRDVHEHGVERLQQLLVDVCDAAAERHELRGGVPVGHVRVVERRVHGL